MFHGNELLMPREVSRFAFRDGSSFALSYGLFALVNAWIPMRVTSGQEQRGLDDSQHGERVK